MSQNREVAKRVNIVRVKMVREASFLYPQRRIRMARDVVELFLKFLDETDREQFFLLCINTKNEPTALHTVSIGSLDASIVHPREVFKVAILSNAASVIVAHNHPSGDPTASQEDIQVTRKLQEAGELLGITLLDHVIVGTEGAYTSLKERGLM
ncbi:JAB domain-containing protein [Brevibacillus borstelensis]|uniref:JAB domain-containing protein n=1 Tax=Brevibacillus borstelensis TaxID=45462 RepID=UPI0015626BB1|nr:JAB domain-containing protein [Brevibacillus borstelensis]MBE5393853.1 JAB domain-containing protein [Brevibacillus borstelensis]MCM3593523.1 JAB domain-containing protein [Brevibacillus borstelensis]